ncbi:unnamed protein product [Cuscuta europaea]|uniref:Uncharacterized protein n=1 Tax=Cuscuta europaea TaxID=41803 RepID=A0A9P0ZUR1_CUSEU|nr:unnamed protein product [Cuscuta europaea]
MKGLRQIVSVSPGETSGSEEIPALARFLFIFFMCQENKSDLKKMQHHVEEASVREVERLHISVVVHNPMHYEIKLDEIIKLKYFIPLLFYHQKIYLLKVYILSYKNK